MISVLIPLYNKAESIENTIKCVQNQTYTDWEIVVVEGHSTDGSLEIIKKLAEEDSRISVFMQENRKGVTPARNESVMHAKSNFLAFLPNLFLRTAYFVKSLPFFVWRFRTKE